jgi:WD40 repeat protein
MRLKILIPIALAAAAPLAATTSAAGGAQAPGRSGEIAFIRAANTNSGCGQLFVVRPDGSGLQPVTQADTVCSYAWSPNGKLIAYISRDSLWLVRPDGTGSRLLVPFSRRRPAAFSWSPNGKKIAFVSRDYWGCRTLRVVSIDGGKPVVLHTTPVVPTKTRGCDVAWSPRGGEIAYDGLHGISEIRPDGTHARAIAPAGDGAQWSTDGTKLAFNVSDGAFAVVGADGRGFHIVTNHAYNAYPFSFAWSPHGQRILYSHAGDKGIHVIGAGGRNDRRVTGDSPPNWGLGSLAWSPAGSSIVYTKGGADNTDLYVIGVDGRGKVQLTNTPDVDFTPSWAP